VERCLACGAEGGAAGEAQPSGNRRAEAGFRRPPPRDTPHPISAEVGFLKKAFEKTLILLRFFCKKGFDNGILQALDGSSASYAVDSVSPMLRFSLGDN
jgi:hypothetical protein